MQKLLRRAGYPFFSNCKPSEHVRVFVASRLEAFIYKEGFARVSTHLYEKGDIGNPFIHLTNSR